MARIESDTERIARLHVPDEEDVSDEVKELWAGPRERLGFVPNVLRVFALRPRHLLAWWAYYDELMREESGLTKAQREMIAVVVSAANRCHYCIVSHSAALRKLTKEPDFVDRLATGYKYADLEPRDRAMLDFAVKLTEASDRCTDEDVMPVGTTRRSWTSRRWRRCSISRTALRAGSAGFRTASTSRSAARPVPPTAAPG